MVERRRFRYRVSSGFELRLVLFSHGWIELEPFHWDDDREVLTTVVSCGGQAVDLSLQQTSSGLAATVASQRALSGEHAESLRRVVPHMLRLARVYYQ